MEGGDGLRRGRDGGSECWMEIRREGEVYWALLERRYEERGENAGETITVCCSLAKNTFMPNQVLRREAAGLCGNSTSEGSHVINITGATV